MSEEVKKPDFYELLRNSPVAVQVILRGLQSISDKVSDGADVNIVRDFDSVFLSTKKSELYVYYVMERGETASLTAVYKKRISDKEITLKRGKIELPRHLAGQLFEAVKEVADAMELGNVTIERIAEAFADVLERVNRFLSEQHGKPSEAGGSGSQAGDGEDDASGDEAETTGRRG